ncbi:hypothetical protein HZQ56_17785 [Elizabethkingia anophelis]|nr:hypothetical protein [Elizabethkingia anophelis]MCT3875030.1 hypothetical protein [Elizabethkingia anophelis]
MENTQKYKAIKYSYGEYWDKVKDYVDKDGWCNAFFNIAGNHFRETESKKNKWRPALLSNIETNNNWIRIECDNDWPKDKYSRYLAGYMYDGKFHYNEKPYSFDTLKQLYKDGLLTHCRKVDHIPNPIY